jgi:hypothetical protein
MFNQPLLTTFFIYLIFLSSYFVVSVNRKKLSITANFMMLICDIDYRIFLSAGDTRKHLNISRK